MYISFTNENTKRLYLIIQAVRSTSLVIVGVLSAFIIAELTLRLISVRQDNYVIEMWKYSNALKQKSDNLNIGHEHIPGSEKGLQNVHIAINSYGLRGPEPSENAKKRVAIAGDSVALGWGVEDEDSLRGQLQKRLPEQVDVINAGVGNMNMGNIVAHWEKVSGNIRADKLILLVSPRATEIIETEEPGFLLKNSQLVAMLTTALKQVSQASFSPSDLHSHYQSLWHHNLPQLEQAFSELGRITRQRQQQVLVVMIPETHDFKNYQYGFMHEQIETLSHAQSFEYFDALSLFKGQEASAYWVSVQDIHLNAKAYQMIAEAVYGFAAY